MKQIKYLYNQDFLLIFLLQSTSPWWKSSQLFNWSKVQQVWYWLHHFNSVTDLRDQVWKWRLKKTSALLKDKDF